VVLQGTDFNPPCSYTALTVALCSEIHYDHIGGRDASHLVNKDDPLVVEIWNNVFIQFNREDDGSLKPLPSKHVDTGMGFERLVTAIQGVRSNYDTDVFTPLFARIQEVTGVRPYTGKFGDEDVDGIDMAYRVVADHVRTLAVALSDGGVPNNVGRGYVLRRILRRGARYARKKLGVSIGVFFSSLVPTLVQQLVRFIIIIVPFGNTECGVKGHVYPELTRKTVETKEILDEEEESFSRTLDRGEKLFEQYATAARDAGLKELNGKDVWRLYDTYGFPVDLTLLMAEELGLGVNHEQFEGAQAASREASKASLKVGARDVVRLDVHDIAALENNASVSKTDDSAKFGKPSFLCIPRPHTLLKGIGNIDATVKAIYHKKTFFQSTSDIPPDMVFGIILDRTSFYAEAGGQEYDTGNIVIDGITDFEVTNVQVFNGYVLHIGHLKYGQFSVGDNVVSSYDEVSLRYPNAHLINRELLAPTLAASQ
jgi:alanyl-tRNA synthetase